MRDALAGLDSFWDEERKLRVRVNYGSLNVEEFGSVYEGLLELQPRIQKINGALEFAFDAGSERGDTGSHYTPDELVQKLVRAGVEPAIEEVLAQAKAKSPSGVGYAAAAESALLGLRVLDSACGSGHMLLGAARRIGLELARVRTGEEQPGAELVRRATRDSISHCVYGVDFNPLAVELCKVALWLEAHEPGKPLGFLDHRIRCGDSLAGLGRFEELEAGIPDEAFKAKPGDDRKLASAFARRNAKERSESVVRQNLMNFGQDWASTSRTLAASGFSQVEAIEDEDLAKSETKRWQYARYLESDSAKGLHALADIKTAQYFLPIVPGHEENFVTERTFRFSLRGEAPPQFLKGYTAAIELAKNSQVFSLVRRVPHCLHYK